jgi:hypothetical protein
MSHPFRWLVTFRLAMRPPRARVATDNEPHPATWDWLASCRDVRPNAQESGDLRRVVRARFASGARGLRDAGVERAGDLSGSQHWEACERARLRARRRNRNAESSCGERESGRDPMDALRAGEIGLGNHDVLRVRRPGWPPMPSGRAARATSSHTSARSLERPDEATAEDEAGLVPTMFPGLEVQQCACTRSGCGCRDAR